MQADLKTSNSLGVFGMSVVTALTAQNTQGVQGVHVVPSSFVAQQIDSVLGDIGATAIKTGMIADPEVAAVVAEKCIVIGMAPLVVDPVRVASSGAVLVAPETANLVRERRY